MDCVKWHYIRERSSETYGDVIIFTLKAHAYSNEPGNVSGFKDSCLKEYETTRKKPLLYSLF